MNIDNTRLFDDILKDAAKKEKQQAPADITDFMRRTIRELPDKPRVQSTKRNILALLSGYFRRIRLIDFIEVAVFALILIFIPMAAGNHSGFGTDKEFTSDVPNTIFSEISADAVEWITKEGGRASNNGFSVLFSGRDDDKIAEILNLLKSANGLRQASANELRGVSMKGGSPLCLAIKLKNGSKLTLMPAYSIETRATDNGMESQFTPLGDRFILFENGQIQSSYTLFSKVAAQYVIETSRSDFITVPTHSIFPENYQVGDHLIITGEGCTEPEVSISVEVGNGTGKDLYIIGKVKPEYGSWKWEGTLDNSLKTYDGKDIPFKNNKLLLGIIIGERRTTFGKELDFSKGTTDEINEFNHSFALYEVKDIKPSDAVKMDINSLPLENEPIFTTKDILAYYWKNHCLKIDKASPTLKKSVPVWGTAFVVTVNGERLYLGALWTMLSSYSPPQDIPVITIGDVDELIIAELRKSGYKPTTDDGSKYLNIALRGRENDPRNDLRIFNFLKPTGILLD